MHQSKIDTERVIDCPGEAVAQVLHDLLCNDRFIERIEYVRTGFYMHAGAALAAECYLLSYNCEEMMIGMLRAYQATSGRGPGVERLAGAAVRADRR